MGYGESLSQEIANGVTLVKSNDLISSKYMATLTEDKIMIIALSKIEINASDKDYPLVAKLYPGELKKIISDEAHIYRDLKKMAKSIVGHTMFLEDGKGNFKAMSIVPSADYIDGVFTIKFNPDLKNHILGLEKNFTPLEKRVLIEVKSNASFRLYELLKKEAYKIPDEEGAYTEVTYDISELRFIIGLANSDNEKVKAALGQSGKHVDWDAIYNLLEKKDRKYEKWSDLRLKVIQPAQKELEEKANIRFEFETIKKGRTTGIIKFRIYKNKPMMVQDDTEKNKLLNFKALSDRQLEIPFDVDPEFYMEFVDHNYLTKEDIDLLGIKAGGDFKKVRRAIEMADRQPFIKNYMGWIIKCIEEGYGEVEVAEGSAEDAKIIKELQNNLKENRNEIAIKTWERIKTKEDFNEFIEVVESRGISFETLEITFTPEELAKAYTDFKANREISL